MEQHNLCEFVEDFPRGVKCRRWVLRAEYQGGHHHAKVHLSECPLYLELHWHLAADDQVRRVGVFRLDLTGLLRGGYVRRDPKESRDPNVRLRIVRDDDGNFYVQTNQLGPRFLLPSRAATPLDSRTVRKNFNATIAVAERFQQQAPVVERLDESMSQTERVMEILSQTKRLAREYRQLTGKPLGVTGEVGEYEAARILKLQLSPARQAGYDALDTANGLVKRLQVKSRCLLEDSKRSQMVPSININKDFDAVLLVLLDGNYEAFAIYEAERESVIAALTAPGSRSRNERGAMAVSKFKAIGKVRWRKPAA